MFEVGKTYKTRDGNKAVILEIIDVDVEETDFPLVAAIQSPFGGWGAEEFTLGGHYWNSVENSGFDLIDPDAKNPLVEAVAAALDALLRQEGGATTDALAMAAIAAYEAL